MGLPLQVFLLGLLTVFMVLMVVVFTGRAIIWVVNRFFDPPATTASHPQQDAKVVAVVSAAVQSVTKGRGRVTKIEKIQ